MPKQIIYYLSYIIGIIFFLKKTDLRLKFGLVNKLKKFVIIF